MQLLQALLRRRIADKATVKHHLIMDIIIILGNHKDMGNHKDTGSHKRTGSRKVMVGHHKARRATADMDRLLLNKAIVQDLNSTEAIRTREPPKGARVQVRSVSVSDGLYTTLLQEACSVVLEGFSVVRSPSHNMDKVSAVHDYQ